MTGFIRSLAIFLIFVFICLYSDTAVAQTQDPVVLTTSEDIYPLGYHIEILEDNAGEWTIEDVTSPELGSQFVPSDEEIPNFGFTDSVYWVRFPVRNEADSNIQWLLKIARSANPYYLDVYLPSPDSQGYEVYQTGTARPFETRDVKHPEFVFKLPPVTGEESVIYLRMEAEGNLSMPLSIYSSEALAREDSTNRIIQGFFYGILFIMIGYNIFLYLFIREVSYLYYVLFFLSVLLLLISADGLGHQFIWPNLNRFNAIVSPLFFVLAVGFSLKFAGSFLHLKDYFPRLDKFLNLLVILSLAIIPLLFINFRLVALPIVIWVTVSFVFILIASVLVWRKGYQPARYYLGTWILFLLGILLFLLDRAGLLPTNAITQEGFRIGIIVLTLGLSVALANRINTYRQERDKSQLEMLHQQKAFAATLQQANKELEKRFEERTRELGFAQEQINALFENSPLAIGTAMMDGQVLSANEAMKIMFGYEGNDIFEANVVDFFPSEGARKTVRDKLIREGSIRELRLNLKRRDGSLFYANLTESVMTRGEERVLLGIVGDITDLVEAERLLHEKTKETAISEERNRLARELHDSVTQTLYTTSLIAEALPKVWETHPDEARRSLEELRSLTQGALAEMRTLLLELRPGDIANRSLSALLHQLINAMSARTEIPITTTIVGKNPLPTDVKIAFYRITQEALNNIVKHAQANRAWVNLSSQNGRFTLRIGDNGRGFEVDNRQPHHLGLKIMKERADKINAYFILESKLKAGTEITVIWPKPEESGIS